MLWLSSWGGVHLPFLRLLPLFHDPLNLRLFELSVFFNTRFYLGLCWFLLGTFTDNGGASQFDVVLLSPLKRPFLGINTLSRGELRWEILTLRWWVAPQRAFDLLFPWFLIIFLNSLEPLIVLSIFLNVQNDLVLFYVAESFHGVSNTWQIDLTVR